MAEFQIVVKEIERLCKTYQNKCRTDECPLYLEDLCYAQAMSHIHEYEAGKLEDAVMSWSEEHPAPEYPTWGEYFGMIYGARLFGNPIGSLDEIFKINIPQDIAEKLGVEPKEE